MTSAFEAPSGPATSTPPPPPPPGAVPPPPPPSAPGGSTPPPPPPPSAPAPHPPVAEPAPTSAPAAPAPAPAAPAPTPSLAAQAPAAPAPAAPPPADPAPTAAPPRSAPPSPDIADQTQDVEQSPSAPTPTATEPDDRHDLTDLLDRLHDDIDVEASGGPIDADAPLTDPRDLDRPTDRDPIVIESTGGLDFRPDFASFGARISGGLVDGIALTVAMIPGAAMILQTKGAANTLIGLILLAVGFFAMNVWYARSVAKTGQWIGNRVAKTKVVDVADGSMIDVGHAGARFAARHLISVILLFGFFAALADSQRRTFHDRIGGSIVVGRARETWTAGDPAE